jgi:hypothetical protein
MAGRFGLSTNRNLDGLFGTLLKLRQADVAAAFDADVLNTAHCLISGSALLYSRIVRALV